MAGVERADIRDHYAQEVERLTKKIESNEERCQREMKVMRERLDRVEDNEKGLLRIIIHNSQLRPMEIPDDISPVIQSAIKQLQATLRSQL